MNNSLVFSVRRKRGSTILSGEECAAGPVLELKFLKIELVDRKTVKITLDENDLDELALTFNAGDASTNDTKRAVACLISKIKEETELDLTGGKLFIEAFPDLNGGCILYVNVIDGTVPTGRKKADLAFGSPLIFCFEDLESLTGACRCLFGQYSHLIRKSSLFLLSDNYYLALCSYLKTDEKLIKLLCEYGRFFGKGETRLSFMKEHAKCIIEDAAIETLIDTVN